jgi:hypothetical protein
MDIGVAADIPQQKKRYLKFFTLALVEKAAIADKTASAGVGTRRWARLARAREIFKWRRCYSTDSRIMAELRSATGR